MSTQTPLARSTTTEGASFLRLRFAW